MGYQANTSSDPIRDALSYFGALDAADQLHDAAVAEWKADARSNPAELRRIVKQYTADYGCDHADLLADIALGTASPSAIQTLITAALDYAIDCGDGPKYRDADQIAADEADARAESRYEARRDH